VSLTLRTPQLDEAEAIARLHIACWREAYDGIVPAAALAAADLAERTAKWQKSLADPDSFVLAAFDEQRPVAFILARPNRDPAIPGADAQIAALYVLKSHHRLRLGSRLMAAAARWWLARGGGSLGLGVLAANARAVAFYERLGGRVVKTGIYDWHGHKLPDAVYVFADLAALGRSA
jgi:ribosomal protein S18 acetylase RimI-like enzyme